MRSYTEQCEFKYTSGVSMVTVLAELSIRKRKPRTHTNSCSWSTEETKQTEKDRRRKWSVTTVIHSRFISSFSCTDSKKKKEARVVLVQISPLWKSSSPSLFHCATINTNWNDVHLLKIAVYQSSAELWTQWLCDSTSSFLSCSRSFQKEPSREEAVSHPGAGRKASHRPRGWWHPPAERISLGEVVGAVLWVYAHKLVEFWQQVDPSNRRDLQGLQ